MEFPHPPVKIVVDLPPPPLGSSSAPHDVGTEFDRWADDGRGDSMEQSHASTASTVLSLIPFHQRESFIDLGCGNGYALRWAATRTSPGPVIGIDVSPSMLRLARRRSPSNTKILLVHGTVEHLPFPNDSIDHLFSHESAYYWPDLVAGLRECVRVLRPGGTFHCGVDYFLENRFSHRWQERIPIPMTLRSVAQWKEAFLLAGFIAVRQQRIYDPRPIESVVDGRPRTAKEIAELTEVRQRIGTLLTIGIPGE